MMAAAEPLMATEPAMAAADRSLKARQSWKAAKVVVHVARTKPAAAIPREKPLSALQRWKLLGDTVDAASVLSQREPKPKAVVSDPTPRGGFKPGDLGRAVANSAEEQRQHGVSGGGGAAAPGGDEEAAVLSLVRALLAPRTLGSARTKAMLVARGADPNDAAELHGGVWPLARAAQRGFVSVAAELLKRLANPGEESMGGSATVKGAEPSAISAPGYTALMLAAINGRTAVARLLLAHGARVEQCASGGSYAGKNSLELARLHSTFDPVPGELVGVLECAAFGARLHHGREHHSGAMEGEMQRLEDTLAVPDPLPVVPDVAEPTAEEVSAAHVCFPMPVTLAATLHMAVKMREKAAQAKERVREADGAADRTVEEAQRRQDEGEGQGEEEEEQDEARVSALHEPVTDEEAFDRDLMEGGLF